MPSEKTAWARLLLRGLLLRHLHLLLAHLLHLDVLGLHQVLLRWLLGHFPPIHAGVEKWLFVAKRRVDRQHVLGPVLAQRTGHAIHPLHQWIFGLLFVER